MIAFTSTDFKLFITESRSFNSSILYLSEAKSGHWSRNPFKVYLGKDKQGKEIYSNIFAAGAVSDAINLYTNIRDYGLIMGPIQTVAGKLGPIPRSAVTLLSNRDYLGNQIVPKGTPVIKGTELAGAELLSNLLPIPFSASNIYRMINDPEKKYSTAEMVAAGVGITTSHTNVPGINEANDLVFNQRDNVLHQAEDLINSGDQKGAMKLIVDYNKQLLEAYRKADEAAGIKITDTDIILHQKGFMTVPKEKSLKARVTAEAKSSVLKSFK